MSKVSSARLGQRRIVGPHHFLKSDRHLSYVMKDYSQERTH
jgi:hypothetical protein